jgi:hypothetical protein
LPNELLLEDFHGIQAAAVLFFDQQHFAIRALANYLNEGEVLLGDTGAAVLGLALLDNLLVSLQLLFLLLLENLSLCFFFHFWRQTLNIWVL